jgi:hypothetical protein
MTTADIQATTTSPPATTQTAPTTAHGFSFHDFLSALNPLQYLPVIGTIYRAVTGDVVPEAVREGGSLLVSGLLGGPVGLVISIATTIAEKATGIDPEKIVADQLHGMAHTAEARIPAAQPAEAARPVQPAEATASAPTTVAMTPEQLAAYGVRSNASGTLKLGNIEGADVLNSIELARLGNAAAAYAANQPASLTAVAHNG